MLPDSYHCSNAREEAYSPIYLGTITYNSSLYFRLGKVRLETRVEWVRRRLRVYERGAEPRLQRLVYGSERTHRFCHRGEGRQLLSRGRTAVSNAACGEPFDSQAGRFAGAAAVCARRAPGAPDRCRRD